MPVEKHRDQVRRFSDMSAVIENIKNRFKKMAVIDKHGGYCRRTFQACDRNPEIVFKSDNAAAAITTITLPPPIDPISCN
ncbi:unnamed protein product, partial [Ilex paraguariensis]